MFKPADISPENPTAFATEVLNSPANNPQEVKAKSYNGFAIQPKLTVGAPDDQYEREADAVADSVMRMPEQNFVQRKCAHCEEEQKAQRKPLQASITPFIQTKSENTAAVSGGISSAIQSSRGRGTTMDSHMQSFMSSRFGNDFSGVKIHTDNRSEQLSRDLDARAFTVGNDIYFNRGQYQPQSAEGKTLLAHELTHVVQQGGSANLVQRQAARRTGVNTVEVEHEGATYRVNRTFHTGGRSPSTSGSVDADADKKNVTITIKVCRGSTKGQLELGANVPERAREVAQKVLQAAISGGNVEAALKDADVTPFVELIIAQSGTFSITARGEVTIGVEGVTGGGGSLGIDIGPFRGEIEGKKDENGGSIGGKITFTPGKKQESFDCSSVKITSKLECEKWKEAEDYPATIQVPYSDEQTRFIYFDYAKASIDRSRSADMLNSITALLHEGYQIKSISGHTSPEGSMKKGANFEGNAELGQQRADAALAEIRSVCGAQLLVMQDSKRCADNATIDVTPIGEGELYTLLNEQGKEVEGKLLAQHAVEQFKTSDAEASHRTPELLERMGKMSSSQQRDTVYPLLRRATITLEKSGTKDTQITMTDPAGYKSVNCQPAVKNAAELQFSLKK